MFGRLVKKSRQRCVSVKSRCDEADLKLCDAQNRPPGQPLSMSLNELSEATQQRYVMGKCQTCDFLDLTALGLCFSLIRLLNNLSYNLTSENLNHWKCLGFVFL